MICQSPLKYFGSAPNKVNGSRISSLLLPCYQWVFTSHQAIHVLYYIDIKASLCSSQSQQILFYFYQWETHWDISAFNGNSQACSCGSEPLVLTVSKMVLWCKQEQWASQCSSAGETERHKTASQHLPALPFSSPRCVWSPVGTRTINSSFWAALHCDGLKPSRYAAWGQEETQQEPPHHLGTVCYRTAVIILGYVKWVFLLALLGHLDLLRWLRSEMGFPSREPKGVQAECPGSILPRTGVGCQITCC